MGGRYVPRPPSAGGVPNPGTRPTVSGAPSPGTRVGNTGTAYSQNEGRTAPNNNNYGRAGGVTANPAETHSPVTSGTPRYGANAPSVPRPTPTYQPNRTPTSTPERSAPAHQAAPPHESSPSTGSHAPHSDSRGPGASLSVPRPPAGYSYGGAPTYSASAGRSTYSAPPSYGAGRSPMPNYSPNRSYGPMPANRGYSSTPAYNTRSYGANPGYSARSYGAAPTYSGHTTSSYSPPRSSGSYRAPSGGSPQVAHGSAGGSRPSSGGGHHGR
jgi:hypothetical protein